MLMMSSDADYAAFLKKSQKDYSQPSETPAAAATSAVVAGVEVHPAVKALGERYYISDADEPFEGISFTWEKRTLPDEGLCFPCPFPPMILFTVLIMLGG